MLVKEPFQSDVAKRGWADWKHVHVGPRDKPGVIIGRWGPYAWVAMDDVDYPVTYHFGVLAPIEARSATDMLSEDDARK